ncbi:MAG: DNA adenine methylase [Prevotella sp.]
MTAYRAKPFIKWAGGKGQLLSTFEHLLPERFAEMEGITYIEPFVGGGAMLFYMLQRFDNIQRAVINDVNTDLITAYNVVKREPETLIRALSALQQEYYAISEEPCRKEFYLSMREMFNSKPLDDMSTTVLLIFLNRTCFNGLYRINAKGLFNVPFGKYNKPTICDEDNIRKVSQLLQKVEISHGDFEQTERFVTHNTFVYFDPPYRPLDATSCFNSYTKDAFDDAEQIRLKCYFDRLSSRHCLLMLSNSDGKGRNPNEMFFDRLYANYHIKRVYASRSVNANPKKRGKLTELLIRNYTNSTEGELMDRNSS